MPVGCRDRRQVRSAIYPEVLVVRVLRRQRGGRLSRREGAPVGIPGDVPRSGLTGGPTTCHVAALGGLGVPGPVGRALGSRHHRPDATKRASDLVAEKGPHQTPEAVLFQSVKVEAFVLANSATVDGALLMVNGGGWEHFQVPFFPFTVAGAACGIVNLGPEEMGEASPVLCLDGIAQDGQDFGWSASMVISGDRPRTAAGVPIRVPFAVAFCGTVFSPTVVTIRACSVTEELAAAPFAILEPFRDLPAV